MQRRPRNQRVGLAHSFNGRYLIVWTLLLVAITMREATIIHTLAPHDGNFYDLMGRASNVQQLRTTGNIYFPFGFEAFTYPPAAIALFSPLAVLPVHILPWVWTSLCVMAMLSTYAVVLRLIPTDAQVRWTLAGVGTWCTITYDASVIRGLTWGQIALLIDLMLVLDALSTSSKWRGVGVGVATATKLYPALFIVLFALRRQWREVIVSCSTAGALTAVATAMWPRSAFYFYRHLLVGGGELVHFTANVPSSVNDSIIAVAERWPFRVAALPNVAMGLVLGAVLILGLVAIQRHWNNGAPFTSFVLTLLTSAVVLPLSRDHYFSFAPLLAFCVVELGWRSPTLRAGLVFTFVTFVPWFHYRHVAISPRYGVLYPLIARSAIGVCAIGLLIVAATTNPPASASQLPAEAGSSATGSVRTLQ